MGDLGTFLPLLLNMAAVRSGDEDDELGAIDLNAALFWAGICNLVTGFVWDSPIPVQPMKTIAAVAITEDINRKEVVGAGLAVGVCVLVLGLTGLIETVNYLTPEPLVRGLQLGLGLSMCIKGLELLSEPSFGPSHGADCILTGVVCFVITLFALTFTKKKIPAALLVVTVGIVIAIIKTIVNDDDTSVEPQSPVSVSSISELSVRDVLRGFWLAGFAQLPLTCLNSVVSVCDVNNRSLFPNEPAKKISRPAISASVGLMNMLTIPFGAMPQCHGAGGLAAQHQFGARGGTSIIFLGLIKILIAVAAGSTTTVLLENYPRTILGVLLFFSGLGLSKAGLANARDSPGSNSMGKQTNERMILLATAGATVALKTGWGCFFGVSFALFYGGFDHVLRDLKRWRQRRKRPTNGEREEKEEKGDPDDDSLPPHDQSSKIPDSKMKNIELGKEDP